MWSIRLDRVGRDFGFTGLSHFTPVHPINLISILTPISLHLNTGGRFVKRKITILQIYNKISEIVIVFSYSLFPINQLLYKTKKAKKNCQTNFALFFNSS